MLSNTVPEYSRRSANLVLFAGKNITLLCNILCHGQYRLPSNLFLALYSLLDFVSSWIRLFLSPLAGGITDLGMLLQ